MSTAPRMRQRIAPNRARIGSPPEIFFRAGAAARYGAYDSAMSSSGGPRVLVARRVDGWLVGWLAVLVWCVAAAAAHWGVTYGSAVTSAVYWTGAVITAAHFGLSYHLAYSGGSPAVRA